MADKLGERHFDNTAVLDSSKVRCVEGCALVVRSAGTFMNTTSVLSTSDQGERHLKKCAERLIRGLHKLKDHQFLSATPALNLGLFGVGLFKSRPCKIHFKPTPSSASHPQQQLATGFGS